MIATTGAAIVFSTLPGAIAGRRRSLASLRAQEHHAQRLLVRSRRPHLGEVERLAQQRFGHRPLEEDVVGAGFGEKLPVSSGPERRVAADVFGSTVTVISIFLSE